MSAKDAPIAVRSGQTLVGVIDKWRMRREFIESQVVRYATICPRSTDLWNARIWAAHLWEVRYGG
jgi:hypothetical protein